MKSTWLSALTIYNKVLDCRVVSAEWRCVSLAGEVLNFCCADMVRFAPIFVTSQL